MATTGGFSLLDCGIVTQLRTLITPTSEKNLDGKVAARRRHSHHCTYSEETKPDPNSEIGKRLNRIYGGKYGDWLRSYGVTPSWETPHDSVEIHVWHGYRPNPSSAWSCMKSVFEPNNETVNFWTHFIPCLLMMFRTYRIFTTLDDPTNVIYYPFWIHCFGCCYVTLVSSGAHMFNSVSGRLQEMSMCCDYSAISVYGITNVIAFELYVCPRSCFMQTDLYGLPYLVMFLFFGWTTNCLSCLSRHPRCPYFHILRSLPVMGCYALTAVPCVARFISTTSLFSTSHSADQSAVCSFGSGEFKTAFLTHLCSFVMAAFFNVCRLPEKRFPGTFDIIGHSHQFFHIFIALGLYTQNILVENVLHEVVQSQKDSDLTAEDMSISPWTTLYPIVTFLVVSTSIVCKCSHILGCQLEKRRLSEKNN